MKVAVKTIKGLTLQIEVPDTAKVADVKVEIEKSQGETYQVAHQSLIFKGQVLKDDNQSLAELEIGPASFMVVMIQKPKAPAAAPSATAPAPTAEEPKPAAPAPAPVPAPTTAAEATRPAAAADPAAVAGSVLAAGTQLESVIAEIMNMGFPRDQVTKALRAAFNNPDRAVEYLCSGHIPEVQGPAGGAGTAAAGAGAGAPAAAAAGAGAALDLFGGAGAGGVEGGEEGGALDALRDDPQFMMIRDMVRANPEALPLVLNTLARSNPELVRLLNENQNEFLQLLQEGGEGEEEMGEGGPDVIEMTEADMEVIGRLEAMGFPRDACLEAFLICDRNEELAANYLLEQGGMGFD